MWLEEKLYAAAEEPGIACLYCDTEAVWAKPYATVVLCERMPGDDLTDFLESTAPFAEKFIVASDISEDGLKQAELPKCPKLLAYLEVPHSEKRKEVLWRAATLLNTEWVCFMRSDERFISMPPGNMERITLSDTAAIRAIGFNHVITLDGKTYCVPPDTQGGIFWECRMFRPCEKPLEEMIQDVGSDAHFGGKLLKRYADMSERMQYERNILVRTLPLSGLYFGNGRFRNYEEIGTEELRDMAHDRLGRLMQYYLDRQTGLGNIGLYTGDSGVLLLLTRYYLWSGDERYLTKLHECLTWIEKMISTGQVGPTFCSGLAGYGWLLCYLLEKGLLDMDEDYFSTLDSLLERCAEQMHAAKKLDQMHGLVGLGLYFLKRRKTESIQHILNVLASEAEYDDNGEIRWIAHSQYKPKRYDFGLAHGMAGILHFLSKAYALGVGRELCRKLGDGIVMFYRHHEMDVAAIGSYYPYSILYEDYKQNSYKPEKCRLAWCYGDLSALSVMYRYAGLVRDRELERMAIERLVVSSFRRDLKDAVVKDAQFCHGASGLAHMYHRIYKLTGRDEFKSAAVYWTKVMLKIGTVDNGSGYVFTENNIENGSMAPCDSLLEGAVGVAMVLLSVLDNQDMDWDEALMLS